MDRTWFPWSMYPFLRSMAGSDTIRFPDLQLAFPTSAYVTDYNQRINPTTRKPYVNPCTLWPFPSSVHYFSLLSGIYISMSAKVLFYELKITLFFFLPSTFYGSISCWISFVSRLQLETNCISTHRKKCVTTIPTSSWKPAGYSWAYEIGVKRGTVISFIHHTYYGLIWCIRIHPSLFAIIWGWR